MTRSPTIVWFFHDLRLDDNIALTFAAQKGPVIPLYIWDEVGTEGGASKWWLHQALEDFGQVLRTRGAPLILRKGEALKTLRTLIKETGARSVTWARRFEADLQARDAKLIGALEKEGVEVIIHPGFLLFDPTTIKTKSGTPFKVFTPFSKACFGAASPGTLLPAPKKLNAVTGLTSDRLEDWHLVPQTATWPQGLKANWQVGEKAARAKLRAFVDGNLHAYQTTRDRPDSLGTSRLSPYLHFGHISPRHVWHAMMRMEAQESDNAASAHRYLLELLWREFAWHLLYHFPQLTTEPLQKSFQAFPWRRDQRALAAWHQGLTGYPLVDAGMRQLWQTGWMHNRVRMITASFLVKHLLISWRAGMDWFWDTLVDADLGANTTSWQWVAGCGADAAPYFRIFNPILQGKKFDPKGEYVKLYVPELRKLDTRFIHEPWQAPAEQLSKAGIQLGKTYPLPIIEHSAARQRALAALKASKGKGSKKG